MKIRYREIVEELAAAIRSGQLTSGTRLPTHRALSQQRHISLVTASRVYAELESMGLVGGELGRGTFVRDIALPPGLGIDQTALDSDTVDLNFNYPSLDNQGELLRSALRQIASQGDIESLLRYQPHAGRFSDREIFARYLATKGFTPSPDNLLIVNGAQHGLAITAMALLKPGSLVAVDALTYPGFKILASTLHLELVAIPVLAEGPDLIALNKLCKSRPVRAVYCMPTLHNPLGWVLSHAQRKEIAAIARQYDLLVIEDAAYAYLASRPPPPVAAFAPERTLFVTGFSKNVATGLRVGAVVCPAPYRAALERTIRATAWNTPSLITQLVSEWIQEGTVSRLERLKRRDARQRQSIARTQLAPLHIIGHPASYFLWLPLSEEIRAEQVASQLLKVNISVSTAEPFSTTSHTPQAIRLALGSVSQEALLPALTRVREVIEYERDR